MPFTALQIQDLANRYELDWTGVTGENNANILLELVNGHPYLVRLAFYYLATKQIFLGELQSLSTNAMYIYQDYLKSQWFILQKSPSLLEILRHLLRGQRQIDCDSAIACQLESLGLIKFRENQAMISCRLYQFYFEQKLM